MFFKGLKPVVLKYCENEHVELYFSLCKDCLKQAEKEFCIIKISEIIKSGTCHICKGEFADECNSTIN